MISLIKYLHVTVKTENNNTKMLGEKSGPYVVSCKERHMKTSKNLISTSL